MPTTEDVAHDFTAMLRLGNFAAAGDAYWAGDVISVEPVDLPDGIPAKVMGIEATRRKCHTRFDIARIDELSIDGPFVTGNQFALFIDMMIAGSASGKAQPFTEIAVFTVCDGRITEERYFYD